MEDVDIDLTQEQSDVEVAYAYTTNYIAKLDQEIKEDNSFSKRIEKELYRSSAHVLSRFDERKQLPLFFTTSTDNKLSSYINSLFKIEKIQDIYRYLTSGIEEANLIANILQDIYCHFKLNNHGLYDDVRLYINTLVRDLNSQNLAEDITKNYLIRPDIWIFIVLQTFTKLNYKDCVLYYILSESTLKG